jgi:AcrR family transcriptional regulator
MSDIAKAAGLSRQAVYLHFPNRAELLISATKHLDEKVDRRAALRKAVPRQPVRTACPPSSARGAGISP